MALASGVGEGSEVECSCRGLQELSYLDKGVHGIVTGSLFDVV